MKKIIITLLIFSFYCNSSFAKPIAYNSKSSFDEKLSKIGEFLAKDSYTTKQVQIIAKWGAEGYTDCFKSSHGTICKFTDLFCLIKQNKDSLSLKCLKESDLDELLSTI